MSEPGGIPAEPDSVGPMIREYDTLDCDVCACARFKWNYQSFAYQSDPPETCECGHPRSRHRIEFRSQKASRR